jgi:Flp pilus assembly pilin Flp
MTRHNNERGSRMSKVKQDVKRDVEQKSASRRRNEIGATVLEWALIAAVVVVAASVIAAVIFRIVENKGADLEACANQPAGEACAR